MSTKYVMIVQCDIAHNRCSGFACTDAFYEREGMFKDYEDDIKYISLTCGGCCGKSVSAKLSHFAKKSNEIGIKKQDVAVHLSSCMVTDNYHYDRCPHVDYIKSIVNKMGYTDITEGSYISENATKKRASGTYNSY